MISEADTMSEFELALDAATARAERAERALAEARNGHHGTRHELDRVRRLLSEERARSARLEAELTALRDQPIRRYIVNPPDRR
jgi:hypothetical protein